MGFISRFFLIVLILSFGELWLLIEVSQSISLLLTLFLCVLTGVMGGYLVRAQGFRTWREIQANLARGQAPAQEIVSGLILIVIGTLLLTPGFITDTIAFSLLIPPLRKAAAAFLVAWFKKKATVKNMHMSAGGWQTGNDGVFFGDDQNNRRPDNNRVIIETEAKDLD